MPENENKTLNTEKPENIGMQSRRKFVPGQMSINDFDFGYTKTPELPEPELELLIEPESQPESEHLLDIESAIETDTDTDSESEDVSEEDSQKDIDKAGPSVELGARYYAIEKLMDDLAKISKIRGLLHKVYPEVSDDEGLTFVRRFSKEGFQKFYKGYKDKMTEPEALQIVIQAKQDLVPFNRDALRQIHILMGDERDYDDYKKVEGTKEYKSKRYAEEFKKLIEDIDRKFGYQGPSPDKRKKLIPNRRKKLVLLARPPWEKPAIKLKK